MRRGHLGQRRADLLHVLLLPECRLAAAGLLKKCWAAELVPHAFAGLALQARDTPHADRRPAQSTPTCQNNGVRPRVQCTNRDRRSESRILSALSAQSSQSCLQVGNHGRSLFAREAVGFRKHNEGGNMPKTMLPNAIACRRGPQKLCSLL